MTRNRFDSLPARRRQETPEAACGYRAMTYFRARTRNGHSFAPATVVDHRYSSGSLIAVLGVARGAIVRYGREGDGTIHWLVLDLPDGSRRVVRADADGAATLREMIVAASAGMVGA